MSQNDTDEDSLERAAQDMERLAFNWIDWCLAEGIISEVQHALSLVCEARNRAAGATVRSEAESDAA